jgi:SAM-dependent methyltransferase
MIWDNLLSGQQAQAPSERLVEFVSRHYRPPANFLDIGPGKHAPNQHFLEARGFDVVSVDISARALKNIHGDITTIEFPEHSFDLIYDINTLCHVESPPLAKIRSWLKPSGRFFSVAPAAGTWRGVGDGKDFTRYATREQIEQLYDCFIGLRVGPASYSRQEGQIYSWVVEAMR